MKKKYVMPLTDNITQYIGEFAILSGSGVKGQITDGENNQDPFSGSVTPTDEDIPTTAKYNNFNLWEDEKDDKW